MIIAGIDEAGLGPALGPLCVCSSIFETNAQEPCLWESYKDFATAKKSQKNDKLLVTDSKIAFNSGGIETLEKCALSFICSTNIGKNIPENLHELTKITCTDKHIDNIHKCCWYQDINKQAVPNNTEIQHITENSKHINNHNGITCHGVNSIILTAPELNKLLEKGLNKSEAVMLQTGKLIKNIYDKFNDQKITITVDKQGGRNFYGPFLMDVLDGAWIVPIVESAQISEYTCGNLKIIFKPKADKDSFATALSSIYAKYLRERFMQMFNDFFAAHVKNLVPTAGYHGDAPRFFEQIKPALKKLGISKDEIWRNK